ncbi:MAG: ribosome small subunit-dependent GTPase A [Bifidobacteriaceae bacterium]|jgi:ribosome biogenesis GTPase|nr:ribosome small subunit-dependent GTPase A [Bifidobacteriaceae bacterium]
MSRADWHSLDEDDVRIRAPRHGSRPRTKIRPQHANAVLARVVRVDRGRYRVMLEHDSSHALSAMRSRELTGVQIVVGDLVDLVGDLSGQPGSLARIVRVQPRVSVLRRSADDVDPAERVIVAGAQQLVIVTALANPPPRPGLIDRCLVAAYDAGLTPVLCLTKADLGSPDQLIQLYTGLDLAVVTVGRSTTSATPPNRRLIGLEHVAKLLVGRVSVLVGHSGVGKSTLVNALVAGAGQAVGKVNQVTGRGRHTSSAAVALPLAAGGWVIDTPGVRSFGLSHVTDQQLLAAFADIAEPAMTCPRGCTHLSNAPDCELDQWVNDDAQRHQRLASFRRLWECRQTPAFPR